ncbi:MAG TPA: hypothetical protein VEU11_01025 [Terriglobales bacterium]|nr:hypothetical protein [Terriglobales bacterium]
MLGLAWRLARGYRLRPWRSPYLRWRIETYSGIHADQIDFHTFWRFVWRHRAELAQYLAWAERERRLSHRPGSPNKPA